MLDQLVLRLGLQDCQRRVATGHADSVIISRDMTAESPGFFSGCQLDITTDKKSVNVSASGDTMSGNSALVLPKNSDTRLVFDGQEWKVISRGRVAKSRAHKCVILR